ncbi:xanthine dehydrogenase family protein molybdopterin-binding subunit [Frigidibacter sp. SD6-1]|uniref:xanthine dehydrogenase family protein molybdopterin-binding subunit n=1 Tax=Frigidibacter sp. SD6-1 TaxID=3032581 RepID=UPI0024DFC41D|nr:xanthine dehydrogenase family protein molybdopterin-binding subunit [Frigidibacter sp. SD6-1]
MTEIGAPRMRKEDARFLRGQGSFTDDFVEVGQCTVAMVRSAHASGRCTALDTEAARNAPGVIAVLTGADYRADGLGPLVCTSLPPALVTHRPNLGDFMPIAGERIRCVGDILAVVIAETAQDARDAAELVSYEVAEDRPVVTIDDALQGVAQVVPGLDNIAFTAEAGDRAATDAAFAAAAHVAEADVTVPRLLACAMEPRAIRARYSPADSRFHLITSTQSPHRLKQALASLFGRSEADFHVIAPDVGGGFGSKGNLSPEEVLLCWAAEKIRRPLSWCPLRSEAFIADFHGRDMRGRARLALDADRRVTAAEFDIAYNMGFAVGPSGGVSPLLCMRMVQGVYDIPVAHSRVTGVLSNLRPTTSYRGAGRPEATLMIESAMDEAARRIGEDTLEFRRRHLVPAGRMPYRTALLDTYDSGDYPALLARAETLFDWAGFDARRAEAAGRGKLLGRGLATYVEVCGVFSERMEIAVEATGNVRVTAGTSSHGQGHETVFAQMVADWLGVAVEDVTLVQGDTDRVHFGRGTWGSRSIAIGGSALRRAADALIGRATRLAALYLKVDPGAVRFDAGLFSAETTNDTLSLKDLARMSYSRADTPMEIGLGLEGVGYFDAKPQNYPSGCHMAEVEIDPQTGFTEIRRFLCVDDVGTVINPLLLDGQVHGGFAQAMGEVFKEEAIHDAAGQLLTSSFMDYGLPKAQEVPRIETLFQGTPTDTNPLGAKGGAEVGIVGGVSALKLALRDALAPLGISDIPMPATPARLWALIDAAQSTDPPA